MNVFVRFLDELLNILDLLFLYFDFLLDTDYFLNEDVFGDDFGEEGFYIF